VGTPLPPFCPSPSHPRHRGGRPRLPANGGALTFGVLAPSGDRTGEGGGSNSGVTECRVSGAFKDRVGRPGLAGDFCKLDLGHLEPKVAEGNGDDCSVDLAAHFGAAIRAERSLETGTTV
jgi:hypothetical protein